MYNVAAVEDDVVVIDLGNGVGIFYTYRDGTWKIHWISMVVPLHGEGYTHGSYGWAFHFVCNSALQLDI